MKLKLLIICIIISINLFGQKESYNFFDFKPDSIQTDAKGNFFKWKNNARENEERIKIYEAKSLNLRIQSLEKDNKELRSKLKHYKTETKRLKLENKLYKATINDKKREIKKLKQRMKVMETECNFWHYSYMEEHAINTENESEEKKFREKREKEKEKLDYLKREYITNYSNDFENNFDTEIDDDIRKTRNNINKKDSILTANSIEITKSTAKLKTDFHELNHRFFKDNKISGHVEFTLDLSYIKNYMDILKKNNPDKEYLFMVKIEKIKEYDKNTFEYLGSHPVIEQGDALTNSITTRELNEFKEFTLYFETKDKTKLFRKINNLGNSRYVFPIQIYIIEQNEKKSVEMFFLELEI